MSVTARAIQSRVDVLVATVRASLAPFRALRTLSSIRPSELGVLRGALSSARTEAAALRAQLAAVDFGEEAHPQRGDIILAAWRWQRDAHRALLRLDAALLAAEEQLDGLAQVRPRQVLAREGDTLQGLAARELGDVNRWPEIALLNQLAPGPVAPGPLWVPAR